MQDEIRSVLDRAQQSVRRRSRHARARVGASGGGWDAVRGFQFSQRVTQFTAIVSMLPAGRVLDLGAGHGIFSRICAAMGWEVTAYDVRATRFPAESGGIRWQVGDVLDLKVRKGEYDLILCLGLLYHLDLDGQLRLLREVSHTPLLLDTHTSSPDDELRNPHAGLLGEMITERGYTGRYYSETPTRTDEERRAVATASWDNARSFWADERSLVRMLADCGYPHVLSHQDPYVYGRTFQLCIPKRGIKATVQAGSPRRGIVREVRTFVTTAARARSAPGE